MKKLLLRLLSRATPASLCAGLEFHQQDWYNHISDRPGVIHIVHKSLEFSICLADGQVTLLNRFGKQSPPLFWTEKRLIAIAVTANIDKFTTISEPAEGPAARQVLITTPDSDYMVPA